MNEYKPTLGRLATLARKHPQLLAGPLSLYQEQERLSDAQLAEQLGCEKETMIRLALCERPRQAPHFSKDVERIAAYLHVDALRLARLIRAAESREALSRQPGAVSPTLLAARDNDVSEPVGTDDEDAPGDDGA